MSKNELIISLSMGNNGQATFRSHDEITSWLLVERNYWAWLSNISNKDNSIQQAWLKTSNKLTEIQSVNDEAIRFSGTDNYGARVNSLNSIFAGMSNDTLVILSKNPKALYVNNLRSSYGDVVAGYCLAMFLNCGVAANQPNSIIGSVAAVLFLRGIDDGADTQREALAELKKEYGDEFSDYQKTYESLSSDYAKLNEIFRQTIEAGRSKFETEVASAESRLGEMISVSENKLKELLVERENELDNLHNQTQQDWDGIKRSFTDQMALQAPVDYWDKQEQSHKTKSIYYAVASAVWLGISLVLLYCITSWLLSDENNTLKIKPLDNFLGIPLWHFIVFIIFMSTAIWVARVLVKLLLSEIHLTTDAAERVVMVKTYLSLLKEGQGPDKNDRSLVLQTLFRPSAYGIIDGDSQPMLPTEWIQHVFKLGGKN